MKLTKLARFNLATVPITCKLKKGDSQRKNAFPSRTHLVMSVMIGTLHGRDQYIFVLSSVSFSLYFMRKITLFTNPRLTTRTFPGTDIGNSSRITPLKFLVLLSILASLVASPLSAQPQREQAFSTFECGRSLKFSAPANWEYATVNFSSVECAIKGTGSGYPNMNVVAEPIHDSQPRTDTQQIQAIIDSYKAVGLLDTRFIKAFKTPTLPGAKTFGAIFEYENNSATMITAIQIVETGETRHILTFLDHKEAFRLSSSDALRIMASVELTPISPKAATPPAVSSTAQQPTTKEKSLFAIFAVIIGVAVTGIAIFLLMRLRSH